MAANKSEEELGDGISVVVPVYRTQDSLHQLYARIRDTLNPGNTWELILVDDGSPSETWGVITAIASSDVRVRGIRLGRNYGQHAALLAGVRAARLSVIVTLDDDLQNPPEEIHLLIHRMNEYDLDVVYGVPASPSQHWSRRWAGWLTRRAIGQGLGVESAPSISSFRAFKTELRNAFRAELGTNVMLDALLAWSSTRFGAVRVRHDARMQGVSGYTMPKLVRFAIDTSTGYSVVPLQFASLLGFATAGFGFVALVWVVLRPLLTSETVSGFPFLASTIAIFSGVQLITLGIIGEYLSRMHFRIMNRPTYSIRDMTPRVLGVEPLNIDGRA